ncbi:MAG: helicase [Bdellovibrionales bacterium]|nr:helicase [Bdellovibrionales bacterium]
MKWLLFWMILLVFVSPLRAQQNLAGVKIRAFTTDGCSMSPDGNFRSDWTECCVDHDFAYWLGGTKAERADADQHLMACITEKSDAVTAEIYFAGVRVGGTAYSITSYRWGYGWNYLRSYRPITDQELELIKTQLGQSLEELRKTYRNTPITRSLF